MKRIALFLSLWFTGVATADDFIVILLDTSGSTGEYMSDVRGGQSGSRLDVAKKALSNVLSKTPTTTKIGLLTFEEWVSDIRVIDDTLLPKIYKMRSRGSTPLYYNIKKAADRILEERSRQGNVGNYKLLVITDGEADHEDAVLNNESTFSDGSIRPGVLNDVMNRNIVVDVIGLDMSDDHSLKTKINGFYMSGNDLEAVQSGVSKAVAEVGFGDSKDVSNEAFDDIKELPESFIASVLQGITTFQNHPIGEKPPIKVVEADGTIREIPVPTDDVTGGGGSFPVILIVAIIFVVLFLVVGAASIMNNNRY